MPADAHADHFEVELHGCRPEPLASYLKALGVLRLVAEQRDSDACGFWRGEYFVLRSTLDREALLDFFASRWRPSPVIAPWNGGSGFYPKDSRDAADHIANSSDPRLADFAAAIAVGRDYVAARGWDTRPEDDDKVTMVAAMRAALPDAALAWLDAAVVLGDARLLFPPLLGTGGNDGRLDFTNNFQQRVVEVLSADSRAALTSSLFDDAVAHRFKGVMGQFQPAANERSNPWDFVLLIEGSLVFAGAATRRLESSGPATLAFPFHAKAGAGLASLTDADEGDSRDEVWLPLWSAPASMRSLRRLFAEGRATVSRGDASRPASTALDFARAVAGLGVDRGIDGFARIGFQVRNGLAYFATPLGRFATHELGAARLLDDIDAWYERFRHKSIGKNAPAAVAVARRQLEQAMFEAATRGALAPTLLALGDAERALARSLSFATKAFLTPVPRLRSAWADAVDDGSCELRLAAALASRPAIRRRWVPLDRAGRSFGRADDLGCVFTDAPLVENLCALLLREDVEGQQQLGAASPDAARPWCSLTDIAQFIDGNTDDRLIERWLRGLALVDDPTLAPPPADTLVPPASYAVLALVHHRRLGDDALPRTAGALQRACAGDASGATAAAIRRLSASGRALPDRAWIESPARTRRIAAALAFPLTRTQRRRLEAMVLPAVEPAVRTPSPESP
ncbi:MAG: type I-U CRISPR-associated protein Csx17 [Deltaproteobacteria bacterium]|nr:type I-U CRISPR-associated protein Csx17 [Deltaproteobacteria bacterium]MBK8717460.1 type I-U CRISPR-associated protein Csx17 [Deltaproteobacteria bacterium]MBP7291752.1 type I-U CRISPR-associated protein Csx17 [Nannocystaceae bacterium]